MAAAATSQRRKVVMVSSTARDLPLHREQVRLASERAGFEPREMMEHLTALNKDAIEASLRMVEDADIDIGILANRYGTVPTGCDLSITEMEYDRAVELGKPRLVFFIHEDHPVRVSDVETGPGAEKLKALKARIAEQRVAAFFKSPEDLRSHVGKALRTLAAELDQPAAPMPPLGPRRELPPREQEAFGEAYAAPSISYQDREAEMVALLKAAGPNKFQVKLTTTDSQMRTRAQQINEALILAGWMPTAKFPVSVGCPGIGGGL